MKNLVCGAGEVGMSLYNVLKNAHETYIRDVEPLELEDVEVLNICFPYSEHFESHVRKYQEQYQPKLTIIHSTVQVGTSRKLGAVHSPIHGKHPNLEGGIKTFIKYVGAVKDEDRELAIKFLSDAGIRALGVKNPETSELSKLYCTTIYGINIAIMKEIHEMCEKHGADFHAAYQLWSLYYNQGYEALGMPWFRKYSLDYMPGKIGGHCVINNCKILRTPVANFILEENEKH